QLLGAQRHRVVRVDEVAHAVEIAPHHRWNVDSWNTDGREPGVRQVHRATAGSAHLRALVIGRVELRGAGARAQVVAESLVLLRALRRTEAHLQVAEDVAFEVAGEIRGQGADRIARLFGAVALTL